MSKAIINGEVISGSSSSASAVEYTKEDGTKTTVQDELNELNSNLSNQYSEDSIDVPIDSVYEAPYDGLVTISGCTSTTMWGTFRLVINDNVVFFLQNGGNNDIRAVYSFKVYKGDKIHCYTNNDGTIDYCKLKKTL